MPTETETIEYLFRTAGLDELQDELRRSAIAGDRTSDEMRRLRLRIHELRVEQRRAAQSTRGLSDSVRGLEGAGRIFGGVFGEVTGVVGDLEAVAEGSAGAMGPAGLAGALGVLAALSVPVVLVKGAQAAVGLARGALEARDALHELGTVRLLDSATLQGLDALEMQVGRLDESLYRIAAETGPLLLPVLTAVANVAERIADASSSPLLDQLADIDSAMVGQVLAGMASSGVASVSGPVTAAVVQFLAGQAGAALTGDTGTSETASPSRGMTDLVDDLKEQEREREAAAKATSSALSEIAFDTGPRFKRALTENIADMMEFSTVLQGTAERLPDLVEWLAQARADTLTRAGEIVGQFGGADPLAAARFRRQQERSGGKRARPNTSAGSAAATATVGGLLGEVPFIGGFLEQTLGILVDIRGFLGGFVRGITELPVQILNGLAESIAEIPALIVSQLPSLLVGVIEGAFNLALSPLALLDNLFDAIVALPGQIAERLVGLPVRLFKDFLGIDAGSGGLFNTGLFDFRPNQGQGGLFGTGALQIVSQRIEGGLRPAPPPAPAQMRQSQPPQVFFGYGPTTLDELDAAQRFRTGFAGGRP